MSRAYFDGNKLVTPRDKVTAVVTKLRDAVTERVATIAAVTAERDGFRDDTVPDYQRSVVDLQERLDLANERICALRVKAGRERR